MACVFTIESGSARETAHRLLIKPLSTQRYLQPTHEPLALLRAHVPTCSFTLHLVGHYRSLIQATKGVRGHEAPSPLVTGTIKPRTCVVGRDERVVGSLQGFKPPNPAGEAPFAPSYPFRYVHGAL